MGTERPVRGSWTTSGHTTRPSTATELGSDFLSGKTTARSLRQDDSGLPFSGDPRRHHRDIALGLMHDQQLASRNPKLRVAFSVANGSTGSKCHAPSAASTEWARSAPARRRSARRPGGRPAGSGCGADPGCPVGVAARPTGRARLSNGPDPRQRCSVRCRARRRRTCRHSGTPSRYSPRDLPRGRIGDRLVSSTGRSELFATWRYDAVFTDAPTTTLQAEVRHRRDRSSKRSTPT